MILPFTEFRPSLCPTLLDLLFSCNLQCGRGTVVFASQHTINYALATEQWIGLKVQLQTKHKQQKASY